ncbi:MAG: proline--tRNA ligase [Bdellovibrionales bacterium]|nr:proline--tRNA ligase [Bdellovibrionales bacterium]
MAEKITPRSENFPEWYQDVVLQAKLADYSPVKGCMVIRPNGYSIWERIQQEMNGRIKAMGVRNAYFPMFIPESFIKKEADHVEGFAPQVAVVTYAGAKDLDEKLVVRPTSETIINSMFAKWVQSYRDLPLLINQWANVVRWEMRTRLFLRTTEFLWQEGHTCHNTLDEAEACTRRALEMYREFAENVLAMPVVPGQKSEAEKFAGALRTYSIEAMMQDGKALQAGTSHNLSDHFAKAFDTMFLDKDNAKKHVFQTSWGVSTRLIGGMIMTHSDDKGLVLPPKLAETHVVIVPITPKADQMTRVYEAADKLAAEIRAHSSVKALPYTIGVHVDKDDTKQAGWKFHEYELIGIPVRIELGPRDLDKGQAVFTRRDIGQKELVPLTDLPSKIGSELASMQTQLLEKARAHRDAHTHEASTYEEFKKLLEEKDGGFFKVPWGLDRAAEEKVKEETKATLRCILLDDQYQMVKTGKPCFVTGKKESTVTAIFARAY